MAAPSEAEHCPLFLKRPSALQSPSNLLLHRWICLATGRWDSQRPEQPNSPPALHPNLSAGFLLPPCAEEHVVLEHGGDDCEHKGAEESWVLGYGKTLQGCSCEGSLKLHNTECQPCAAACYGGPYNAAVEALVEILTHRSRQGYAAGYTNETKRFSVKLTANTRIQIESQGHEAQAFGPK